MGLTKKKSKRASAPEPAARTRVFWSGRSQAIRLPKAFRLDVDAVSIRREGSRLIIEPLDVPRDAKGWPLAFWELAGAAPDFDTGERPREHERRAVLSSRS